MNQKSFDIIVAKEYETKLDGQTVKKTVWNRVGSAWPSKSYESISFELYLIPGQRYVISLKERDFSREAKPEAEGPTNI